MHVAILTSYFYHKTKEFDGEDRIVWGGAERFMYELCRFLKEEGHDVAVFQPLPKGNVILQKKFKDILVMLLPGDNKWEYSTDKDLNYTFNEMTVSFDLRIYFTTFLCWPEVRLPAISVNHGIFWDMPSHMIRNSSEEHRKEFLRRQMYGVTAPDACVAVDTNVRGVFAAMEPGRENRIHVIQNFVDTEVFKPTQRQEEPWGKRPCVLYPRRLSSVRGVNDFLWLVEQFPDVDFLACGNATDVVFEDQLRGFLDGKKNVKSIWRPMEQMAEIYQQADIAVIPTRSCEGTSLSCLEAMATGLPVIATPAGGLPNLVIDNWNGLVVDLNHGSLTETLKRMLDNPDQARKMGQRGREMAIESFDINIWRRKWKAVIDRIMRQRKG